MKITIDTKEDSHEDIRKVMQLLANFVEQRNNPLSQFSGINSGIKEPVDTTPMMGMFADSPAEKKDTAPDFSSFLNLTQNNKKDDEDKVPKIEFF